MKKLLTLLFISSSILLSAQVSVTALQTNTAASITFDTCSFDLSGIQAITTSSSLGISGFNGISMAPDGQIYVIFKDASGNSIPRYLGLLDRSTSDVSLVGALPDGMASIAFSSNGTLYGVTGDGAPVSETLYAIDITSGSSTIVTALGNGNDGECIAFNPDDNLLYHWSGWGSNNIVMETIDLSNNSITNIVLSGDQLDNVGAAAYLGNGIFVAADVNDNALSFVSSNGVVTDKIQTSTGIKGLLVERIGALNTNSGGTSFCPNDTLSITAAGLPTSTFDWFMNGTSMGQTTASISATAAGDYYCVISDTSCGGINLNSDTLSISVSASPNVSLSPTPVAYYCPGDSVMLSVNSGGNASIQWYMNGSAIAGATTGSYYASMNGIFNCTKTNSASCTDSAAVGIIVEDSCLTVSVLDQTGENAFLLAPNPANEELILTVGNELQATLSAMFIMNTDGKLLQTIKPTMRDNVIRVNLRDLEVGAYLLVAQTPKKTITQRFIIAR